MKKLLVLLMIITHLDPLSSQLDTLRLKQEIDSLSKSSVTTYLDKIFKEDQSYRGANTSVESDLQRIVSISYYFNKFGYPSIEDFGENSNAPRLIWIHNKFSEIGRITFPLIYNAFLLGQISEYSLRSYYLRQFYQNRFDDTGNLELELRVLFDTLGLNISNYISINDILVAHEEIKALNSFPKKESTTWNAAEKSKWVIVNGERKFNTYKTSPVEMFALENGKIYFQKLYSDNSYERKELIKIDVGKYKFKEQNTDKYFLIDDNGDLLYRNDSEVFDRYPAKL